MSRRPSPGDAGPAGNEVSGIVVGPSVQALDVHGGVHFHGTTPPATFVPRQAPGPLPHFAGRRAELQLLRNAGARTGSTVVVLSGPGGVGKTALAQQWAHEAAAAFPQGQLYASCGGFGGAASPTDPAETLRSFLRALGVPSDGLPVGLMELAALYRSRTSERALLVVLDDAFSAAQVRVLVPASSSSMTVVTSRSRLSGLLADGAALVEVTPLTTEDSLALLTNILGPARVDSERQQAVRLTQLCAGLPIALCLAAARLLTRPRFTMAGVVAALAAETDRLAGLQTPDEEASVGGSFELSYRALGMPAAVLYRRLSLHPGREFGLGPVVGLLAGVPAGFSTAEVSRLVEVLLEVNLLQEVGEERFRFHDLIRLHARQKVITEDTQVVRDEALLAVLEWYLAAASAADMVVTPYRRRLVYRYGTAPGSVPTFADRDQALAWLDQERVNLRAAGQAALDQRWAELAWQLSDVLWPLQLYRKSVDRRDIDLQGLTAAKMWGDPRAEGRMFKRLGRTYSTLGEHGVAEQHLRTAIARYTEAGDVEGAVEAEEMLALSYRDAGRNELAMDLLREVLATRRRHGNMRDVGLTLINLGELLSQRGRIAEGLALLREAGDLLNQSISIDQYNPVRVRLGLARAHLKGGDLIAADRAAIEAVDGMRRLGSAIGEADALEVAGWIAERRGDAGRSRTYLQRALVIMEAHGSPRAAALRQRLAAPPAVQEPG